MLKINNKIKPHQSNTTCQPTNRILKKKQMYILELKNTLTKLN